MQGLPFSRTFRNPIGGPARVNMACPSVGDGAAAMPAAPKIQPAPRHGLRPGKREQFIRPNAELLPRGVTAPPRRLTSLPARSFNVFR